MFQQQLLKKTTKVYDSLQKWQQDSIKQHWSLKGPAAAQTHLKLYLNTAIQIPQIQCTRLGSEIGGWSDILVLGLHSSPRVVYFETLVAIACTAVHAALRGFLRWRFAEVTHDSYGCPGCLPVSFHNGFQRKIAKQAIDATFSKINVMLTARTRKHSCSRSQWIAFSACVDSKSWFRRSTNRRVLGFKGRSVGIYEPIPNYCSTSSKPVRSILIHTHSAKPKRVSLAWEGTVMFESRGHYKLL